MKNILLMMAVIAVLAGCKTVYSASYTNPESGAVTTMNVATYREFPGGIKIFYDREQGRFVVEAGEVTNGSEIEAIRDTVLGVRDIALGVRPPVPQTQE